MKEVKKRGFQYLVMVLIAASTLVLVSQFFKKEELQPSRQTSTRTTKSKPAKTQNKEFQKTVADTTSDVPDSQKKVKADSINDLQSTSTEEWYKGLLEKYSTNAKQVPTHDDVVIRYYRKPQDGNKIDQLKQLGYYIHERSSNKELQKYFTNTIYYGDSVKREDILLVAYQLRLAGVKLQAIEHSRFGDNWKSHSIELGTDTTMLAKPELSLDTIRYIVENNPFITTRRIDP